MRRTYTMKYLSFAIPCYNSQDYMSHAIESILPGGEDVEIIIVNDGSKDDTSRIAHEYQEKYPDISRWWTATTGWTRSRCTRSLRP